MEEIGSINPTLYLTSEPVKLLLVKEKRSVIVWDGRELLTLYVSGRQSILHFRPGDAVRVKQSGNIIKLSKVSVPPQIGSFVLWAIGAEKGSRKRSPGDYSFALSRYLGNNCPEQRPFTDVAWLYSRHKSNSRSHSDVLFLLEEPLIRVARLASSNGRNWRDIAAYCDPGIDTANALALIERYGCGRFPMSYIESELGKLSSSLEE